MRYVTPLQASTESRKGLGFQRREGREAKETQSKGSPSRST